MLLKKSLAAEEKSINSDSGEKYDLDYLLSLSLDELKTVADELQLQYEDNISEEELIDLITNV